jgi:hypothetical protein
MIPSHQSPVDDAVVYTSVPIVQRQDVEPPLGDALDLTLSTRGHSQTGETGETYFPTSNAEFLDAVFTGLVEPYRPFVSSFAGHPHEAHSQVWSGTTWQHHQTLTENSSLNWYFTLSTYVPLEGRYRRKKEFFAAAYGVMLDDIGTKAQPLSRLDGCPPSFVIETSDGNYQVGYLFDVPQTDVDRIKGLNQSLVDANLCDSGAKSPDSRWGRLPFASNGKHQPAFRCKLVSFNPERRYTIDAIVDGLELAPPKRGSRKTRDKPMATVIDRNHEEGVYIPRPEENEVIAALKKRGFYKSPLGGGKHDVTCPWVHEHTDQVDHGAAYFEPSDAFTVGGFKCQHSHGDKYRVKALLDHLEVTFEAAKHKPTIKVDPGELHRIVDAGELVLADTKRYYQRGGLIVAVSTDPESKETAIKPVSQPSLVRALSGGATWMRYDARSEGYVNSDPPARHVQVLFDSERYNHLPALSGIARQPHLRADGSLVREAGFDVATGLFGVFDTRRFSVPAKPTKAQALEALGVLRGLLVEFEFASAHDEAATVAGMLTAAIRPSLPTSPMFHVKAPQIASGKSYLSGIIAAFASPSMPSAVAFPSNEEECQKLLLATLLAAPGVVTFDNLTTDLIPFKSLCSALTEEFLTGRILGMSKTATVGTRALILSSGNNVEAVRDMARRCITIALDPKVETPATRQFSADPLGAVRAQREHFVSLALIIIRAWLESGDAATTCKPLASYTQWSAWVRQSILWLGLPDPADRVFEQLAHDPDRETLGRLLSAWCRVHGNRPTMIREAVTAAEMGFADDAKNLREALLEIADERGLINRRRLGRWIARHQGRIVDGQRFERASTTTSAEQWIVQSVTLVSTVCSSPLLESVKSRSDAFVEVL